MTGRANLYLGKAGQMVVMAEFLERGWNVGAPEVDVGDDVFVVRDADGDLSRIQVKTARAKHHNYGYSGQFRVGETQLQTEREPPLDYVFAVRTEERWGPFLVIRQMTLYELVETKDIGSKSKNGFNFRIRYEADDGAVTRLECSGEDMTAYLNDFSNWERIEH